MAIVRVPARKWLERFASVRKQNVEVESFLVRAELDFGKQTISPALQKRLLDVARKVYDKVEDECHDLILKQDLKIQKLLDKAKLQAEAKSDDKILEQAKKEAAKMVAETTTTVKNATKELSTHIKNACDPLLKKEKNYKQLNTEFKVKVTYKVAKNTIKLALGTLEVVATPVNPKAWIDIGKSLKQIGSVVADALKGEDKIKMALFEAIAAYTKQLWQDELRKDQSGMKDKIRTLWTKHKDRAGKAEKARQRYDIFVGAAIKKLDSASTKLKKDRTKLNAELKKIPKIKDALTIGVKTGAALMKTQQNITQMQEALVQQKEFADDMAMLLTEQGIEVKRKSFQSRLKSGEGLIDLVKMAKDVKSTVEKSGDLVMAIAKLV